MRRPSHGVRHFFRFEKCLTPQGKISVEWSAGLAALVLVGAVIWSLMGQDVRLCKRVFAGLVQGDQSVRKHIDWEHLKALDVDVGTDYTKLPSADEQAAYQQGFVRSFSEGFVRSKADPAGFAGWRAQSDGTVTVEYPAKRKTVVFQLSENGKQVSGLAWK